MKSNFKVIIGCGPTKFILLLALLLLFFSWLAGGLAGRHPTTSTIDIGFSASRIILCLCALFWLNEIFSKPIEHKYVAQHICYPKPRYVYLLSSYFSIAIALFVAVLFCALILWCFARFGSGYEQVWMPDLYMNYGLTWLFMYFATLILLAFVALVACISTTPNLAILFGFSFYLIGYSIGPVISYLELLEYADEQQKNYLLPLLHITKYVIPDLSLFDVRDWSLYNESPIYTLAAKLVSLTFLYCMLFVALACMVFKRREFV